MFCRRCGQRLEALTSFCPKCGTSVQSSVPYQTTMTPKRELQNSAITLVFVCCLILALIAVATLNGAAAIVALVCIVTFCFGWSKRGIGVGPKILFCVFSVILVLVLNGVQQRIASVEAVQVKERQEEARRINEQKAIELRKKEDLDFSKLTPTQHLDRAKATLKVGADPTVLALANKDLDVLSGTDLASQAKHLRSQYADSEVKAERAATIAAEKSAKEERALEAKVDRVLRDQMAKSVENSMLDEGYNVDVTAEGPDHTTLRFKWIFVSKVFAHQLSERSEVFDSARKIGFKKIVATDGYDESWTWKL